MPPTTTARTAPGGDPGGNPGSITNEQFARDIDMELERKPKVTIAEKKAGYIVINNNLDEIVDQPTAELFCQCLIGKIQPPLLEEHPTEPAEKITVAEFEQMGEGARKGIARMFQHANLTIPPGMKNGLRNLSIGRTPTCLYALGHDFRKGGAQKVEDTIKGFIPWVMRRFGAYKMARTEEDWWDYLKNVHGRTRGETDKAPGTMVVISEEKLGYLKINKNTKELIDQYTAKLFCRCLCAHLDPAPAGQQYQMGDLTRGFLARMPHETRKGIARMFEHAGMPLPPTMKRHFNLDLSKIGRPTNYVYALGHDLQKDGAAVHVNELEGFIKWLSREKGYNLADTEEQLNQYLDETSGKDTKNRTKEEWNIQSATKRHRRLSRDESSSRSRSGSP